MSGSIYLLGGDGTLEAMSEQPYDSESLLQELLASYPDLLAGEQMNPDTPRRWLLVRREAGIPDADGAGNRWSVDHLFLDQDAIPTLVEVKRGSDSRIRREVVGQMLDYAANAVVHWPVERIRALYEADCESRGADAEESLRNLIGEDADLEGFWSDVKTNLRAGRIRLVFVADIMPPELTRIVEFLNEQMDPAEVLAVEVRQYVGDGRSTLVPRVVGQSAQAQAKKAGGRASREWTEESLFAELAIMRGEDASRTARRLLEWGSYQGLRIMYGKGQKMGSLYFQLDVNGLPHWTFVIWTTGAVELQFQLMKTREPFASEERRRELANRLNAIPGIEIPPDGIARRPSITLEALGRNNAVEQFQEVFEWYVAEVRASAQPAITD